MSKKDHKNINIKNRRATFDYEVLEKLVAGMVLTGTEIKSIREGNATIGESHCFFKGKDLWIKNMHIKEYGFGGAYNHDPLRDKKLLLNKKEAEKWKKKIEEKGLAVIPLRLFISDTGYAKLELALGRGKKVHDKRDNIQKRDVEREMARAKLR